MLAALLAVVPGLVAGTVYLSQTNPTVGLTSTSVGGATCVWSELNTTDQLGEGGTGQQYVTVSGQGTAAVTLTFNVTKGALYQYMIDEVGLVCTTTAAATHFDVNVSTSGTASGVGVSYAYATLQNATVNTVGRAGAYGAKGDWIPTVGVGNNPGDNPTSAPAAQANPCDKAGPVYAPYNGYFKNSLGAQEMAGTYSWSLNSSAWTVDGCTTGHAGPGTWSDYYGATPLSNDLIYTLSIELVSVGASGFTTNPTVTFTATPFQY